jgi:hypothetical protein
LPAGVHDAALSGPVFSGVPGRPRVRRIVGCAAAVGEADTETQSDNGIG